MKTDNLFRLIQDRCDPDDVVDILGIGTGELCLALRGQILAKRELFEEFLDVYEEEEYESDY
jgi:hypothetical protein